MVLVTELLFISAVVPVCGLLWRAQEVQMRRARAQKRLERAAERAGMADA
jgi:hypothetical protein